MRYEAMRAFTYAGLILCVLFLGLIGLTAYDMHTARPYTGRVYAAQNVWRIMNAHTQGTASPVACRQVKDKWVVTFITAKHLIHDVKDDWEVSRNKQTLIEGSLISQHAPEDAALVAFTSATYIDIIPIESRSPVFGEEVWAVGYPGLEQPIITQGIVSHLFLASASSFYGCSGGPVIDSRGRVIGIVVGILGVHHLGRTVSVRHIMRFTPIVGLEDWLTAHDISH